MYVVNHFSFCSKRREYSWCQPFGWERWFLYLQCQPNEHKHQSTPPSSPPLNVIFFLLRWKPIRINRLYRGFYGKDMLDFIGHLNSSGLSKFFSCYDQIFKKKIITIKILLGLNWRKLDGALFLKIYDANFSASKLVFIVQRAK